MNPIGLSNPIHIKNHKYPIVFAFNILSNYYLNFGLYHFMPVHNVLRKITNQSALFPIVNSNITSSIATRTNLIKDTLPKLLQQLQAEKCHIIAYSLSGVDFRYYISEHNGDNYIASLTTLASPNRGLFLADSAKDKLINGNDFEPIAKLCGVPKASFNEFCTDNITAFNTVVKSKPNVKFYSVTSEQDFDKCPEYLKEIHEYIALHRSKYIKTENDGVICPDEAKWGEHFAHFYADHGDLVGLRSNTKIQFYYDNICNHIIKNE